MRKLLSATLIASLPSMLPAATVEITLSSSWTAADYDVSSTGPVASTAPQSDDDLVFGIAPSAGSLSLTLSVESASGSFFGAGINGRVHDFWGYTDVSIVGGSFSYGSATWSDADMIDLTGADNMMAKLWTDGDITSGTPTLASFRMIAPWQDANADIFFGSRTGNATGATEIIDNFLIWEYFGGEEVRVSNHDVRSGNVPAVAIPASGFLILAGMGGLAMMRRYARRS